MICVLTGGHSGMSPYLYLPLIANILNSVLLYEMLAGLPPFYDENTSEMYRKMWVDLFHTRDMYAWQHLVDYKNRSASQRKWARMRGTLLQGCLIENQREDWVLKGLKKSKSIPSSNQSTSRNYWPSRFSHPSSRMSCVSWFPFHHGWVLILLFSNLQLIAVTWMNCSRLKIPLTPWLRARRSLRPSRTSSSTSATPTRTTWVPARPRSTRVLDFFLPAIAFHDGLVLSGDAPVQVTASPS